MNPAALAGYDEMRRALVIQIDSLIDIAERHAWTDDPDEKRMAQGAIDHARKVAAPYRYNGATPADALLSDDAVTAAARAICNNSAGACGVHPEDDWKFYSEDYKNEARIALSAAIAKATGSAT